MKERSDRAEVLVCCRAHQGLLNDVFMTRLTHILMEKSACEILRFGGCFGSYLCIWRCQNKLGRPRERGNIVRRCLDGFHALGMVRFHQYLSFHLDFQLQKLMLALKMEIFVGELEIISSRECWNVIVVHGEVRGDASVSGYMLGLTRIGVVVVEIWGEVFRLGGIWWRSQWGEWYGVPESCGMVL